MTVVYGIKAIGLDRHSYPPEWAFIRPPVTLATAARADPETPAVGVPHLTPGAVPAGAVLHSRSPPLSPSLSTAPVISRPHLLVRSGPVRGPRRSTPGPRRVTVSVLLTEVPCPSPILQPH